MKILLAIMATMTIISDRTYSPPQYLEPVQVPVTIITQLTKEETLLKEEPPKAKELIVSDELWRQKAETYPAAATIWKYLVQELGYNEYVAAGILGNIMAETGGQTLNIQWWLSGRGYAGMCQWYIKYTIRPIGNTLIEQCNYLRDTIQKEFNTFGFCYKKGFKYKDFLKITDAQVAAYAFCVCYERPGPGSYAIRKKNALIAYKYFSGALPKLNP